MHAMKAAALEIMYTLYNQKFETHDHILNLVPVRILHLLLELSNLHFTLLPQFIKGHLQTAVYLGGQVNFHVSTQCQIELLTEAGQLLTGKGGMAP